MKIFKNIEKAIPFIITALFFLSWEWASSTGIISRFIFPQPSRIIIYLFTALQSSEFWINLFATISRLLIGFIAGGLPGLALGLLMGWQPRVRSAIEPIIGALHPIPKITLFPLLLVIFGIGETSSILLIALAVFFPTLINAVEGVRQIPPVYFEVAQNVNASRGLTFYRVILPASMPFMLAGARIALNIGLIVTLTIELINGSSGLGVMMWFGWQMMRLEQVYGIIFVVSIIGLLLNSSMNALLHWFSPWHTSQNQSEY